MARRPDCKETLGVKISRSVSVPTFPLSLPERDEHDARHQYSLRPHEGQPAVLDPEGLPVQR